MTLVYILCPVICLTVCLPLMYRAKGRKLSILFKTLGTVCALILALTGAIPKGGAGWWCAGALALCAAADAMLEIHFLSGMGLFIGGHACYCAWYLRLAPVSAVHGIVFAALLLLAATLLYRWRDSLGKWRLPFAFYAAVLCLMGGLATGTGLALGDIPGLTMTLGGLLFILSDVMVAKNILTPMPRLFGCSAMVVYYTAQLLLGLTGALL